MGDCVVRHCHLHPLYSWQDILLTLAEMELDSTTMFTHETNVMFIRSTREPVLAQQVVFCKGHSRREMGSKDPPAKPAQAQKLHCKRKTSASDGFKGLPMY